MNELDWHLLEDKPALDCVTVSGVDLKRGDRMSLIQFGSRCDLYLPLHYQVKVKIGDKVVGSQTVMAAKNDERCFS